MGAMVTSTVRGLRDAEVRFDSGAAGPLRLIGSGPGRTRSGPGPIEVPPDTVRYDAAIVATDAAAAAAIIGGDDLGYLRTIEAASVVLVTLGFPAFDTPAGVSGFLVPRAEGGLMTACSFLSAKWPHASDDDRTVVRISAGRAGATAALDLSDDELVERLTSELGAAVGRRGLLPGTVRVSRWPASFPQYRPGHAEGVAHVEAALRRRAPNVALAGSSYHGAGVPACIASGRRAARRVRASVVGASA
jgi:oxygen-dependent protoporphyrinogen oxidase